MRLIFMDLSISMWVLVSLIQVDSALGSSPKLTLGTFNTQLYEGAHGFQERKDLLIKELSTGFPVFPEVLCLQEVFSLSTQQEISNGVKSQYPYVASFFDLTAEPTSDETACEPAQIQAAGTCFFIRCNSDPTITENATSATFNLLDCYQNRCRSEYLALSQSCLSCFAILAGSVSDPITHCTTRVPKKQFESPTGLMILSKRRLHNIEAHYFISNVSNQEIKEILPRGYLKAKVGTLDIVCTHLSAIIDVGGVPNVASERFQTNSEQQLDEVFTLLKLVEQKASIVLLGDFNHGPAVHSLDWEAPFNFGLMHARGLVSVNALWCAECTYCSDNPLYDIKSNGKEWILDHIYFPYTWIPKIRRVWRNMVTERTPWPSGLPLSDHYGVACEVRIRRPWPSLRKVCSSSKFIGKTVPFATQDDIADQLERICPV